LEKNRLINSPAANTQPFFCVIIGMMKRMLLILPVLTALMAYGQQPKKGKRPASGTRFAVGAGFSPDICNRTLRNTDGSASSAGIIDIRNAGEIAKPGYTAGLHVIINPQKRLQASAGIRYSNKGYTTKRRDAVFTVPDPLSYKTVKYTYSHHYIDIPLKLGILTGTKRLRFIAGGGFTINLLLSETILLDAETNSGQTDRKKIAFSNGGSTINISPAISAGVDYRINNHIHFRAEPAFSYGLVKLTKTPVTTYLWNAGLNMSLYYKL
jgi:Outer membrane protein beta-barrel domain